MRPGGKWSPFLHATVCTPGWLIPLSAMTLALLCALCMDVARRRGTDRWWDLYEGMPPWVRIGARLCAAMMLAVTAAP